MDTLMPNLLATVPSSDAIQEAWCKSEEGDECTVTLRNYTADQNDIPSSEASDAAEFHKAAKALQDLIFSEEPNSS
jgi:hypothetical protein